MRVTNRLFTTILLHHLILGVFEAVRHIVDGLVLGDGVLLDAGLLRKELSDLGFVGEAVLELPERGEQAGAVRLQVAVLAAQAKLHREPVALPHTDG